MQRGNPGGSNPNYARDERSTSNLQKGRRSPSTRYVTAGQLLDAIEDRFGEPFAATQANIFKEYYNRFCDPNSSAQDQKLFLQLFLHFSNKLTQAAPQQMEVADTTKDIPTDELKARAKEIALTLASNGS